VVVAPTFQFTVEFARNPAPCTVSVNPEAPGAALTGETLSISGTGLTSALTVLAVMMKRLNR